MADAKPRTESDVMEAAREYEERYPGVAQAMQLLGISMERYEASLAALYTPTIVTSNATEAMYGSLERPAHRVSATQR